MFKEPATCDPHVLFSLHSVADRMCYIISPHTGIKKIVCVCYITLVFAGSSSDCVATIVMSGILHVVGLVSGFAGVLVVYCCVKWQSKHHPPPSQPAPLYEEIVTSPFKGEVELQLRDNVAYGQVR